MLKALFVLPLLLVGLAGLGACSSSSDDATSSGNSTAGCDTYAQGMSKAASDLQIAIVDSQFTPSDQPAAEGEVQKGMNRLTVLVTDSAKNPVDGVDVTLALFMPDHGHGSAAIPKVTPLGGGKYDITNVWLPMAGKWKFTLQVNQSGALKTTDFNFCIEG